MTGGRVIREARLRAGLTQAELASRLDTQQSVVARWERGRREPSLERVLRAVRACGLDLHVSLAARDDDHDRLITEHLAMDVSDRLDRLLQRLEVAQQLSTARRIS